MTAAASWSRSLNRLLVAPVLSLLLCVATAVAGHRRLLVGGGLAALKQNTVSKCISVFRVYLLQVLRWVAGGGMGHLTWAPTVYGLEEGMVRNGFCKCFSLAVEQ